MIKLKGTRNSMLRCVIPEELDAGEFKTHFAEIAKEGQQILPGSRVVLDFGARPLTEALVCALLADFVWPTGIQVAAWITYDAVSQDLMKRVGLPTSEPAPAPSKAGPASACNGLVLYRSLRSGQRVEHSGDVIVAGHVNDGAEIYSSGNVTVLGRLKGLVHAGCEGNESVAVAARSMEALQVRIADKFGSLERGAAWWGKQVIARVDEGSVLIDYWPPLKNENRAEGV